MYRVTGDLMKNDLIFNVQNNMQTMDRLHNNLATGKKASVASEDVVGATHSMLYRTRIEQIRQYIGNIDEGSERLTVADDALRGVSDIMKRFEELAVQGANGIYTDDDRAKIAVEIDELLKQLVQIGNSKFKGDTIFSGHKTDMDPFLVETAKPSWSDREIIVGVRYRGNVGQQMREIEQGEYVPVNLSGNKVFWTSNQVLRAANVNQGYAAPAAGQFRVDGKVIDIAAGDNIDTILAKINSSGAAVYASRTGVTGAGIQDPTTAQGIQITTTSPHELWVEDIGASTVLQDLGLAGRNLDPNQAPSGAGRKGLSLFDMAIQLRDDLWKGDVKSIGGRDIGMLQSALDNVMKNNAEIGARMNRFDTVKSRLSHDETSMQDILAKAENIDFPETIMNLRMLEYVHQSALASGARILKPSLIDFLR